MHLSLKKLANPFNTLNLAITQGAKDSENRMIPFGIFGLVAALLYYLINLYLLVAPAESYDTLSIRIVISVLCFFLILKDYWPKKLRPFLPIYWYLTVLYTMPFFITFMTLKNHASSAWVMNLLSVAILMMLLVDWASYTVLFISGGLLAWLTYYLTTPGSFVYIPGALNMGDIVSTFLISIIMGIIFSRNKAIIEQEKLQAMAAVGGSIAHELRTPLLAIDSGVTGLRKYFPVLFETYQYAIKNGWPSHEIIRPDRFEILLTVLDDITAETQYSNVIIDMLLQKVNTHPQAGERTICSIRDCIDDALRRYPFQSDTHYELITWTDANNFKFKGSHLLIVHVLFNLFKNALFFIEDAGKGHILIWTEIGEKTNTLHFKDTAKGIAPNVLSHLFKRFYSTTLNGTGLGLAFCKMVMTSLGGDIICVSKEGEYAEFIMTFPKVDLD